jgi:hypothetical protein
MMKLIFLTFNIFIVPIAYYLWMGGWDPIPTTSTEMVSSDRKSIMPFPIAKGGLSTPNGAESNAVGRALDLPRSSKGQERTIGPRDNPPIFVKGHPPSNASTVPSDRDDYARTQPRTVKETVAILEPDTPGAHDLRSSTASRVLDPEQIMLLLKQGEQFIAAGDFVTARIAFQRAAEAGDANAALAVGATYDPIALAKLAAVGIRADVAKARSWYRRADKLGSSEAKRRLDDLADRE